MNKSHDTKRSAPAPLRSSALVRRWKRANQKRQEAATRLMRLRRAYWEAEDDYQRAKRYDELLYAEAFERLPNPPGQP